MALYCWDFYSIILLLSSQHTSRQEVQQIISQIATLRKQEEQFWGMRSRIKWLHWGDQNTRFFHATTIQRRQNNRITMLQLEDQSWCREPTRIQQHIKAFYENLYSSDGPQHYQPILDQCPSPITESINEELVAIPLWEEIKEAVSSWELSRLQAQTAFMVFSINSHGKLLRLTC